MRGEIAEVKRQIESLRLAGLLTVTGFEEQQRQFENHARQLHLARLHAESVTKLLQEQGDNLLLQHLLLQSVLSRVETIEQLAVATGRALTEFKQDMREMQTGLAHALERLDERLSCVESRTACYENVPDSDNDKENADATGADVQVTG